MGSLGGYIVQMLGHFGVTFGYMKAALDDIWVALGSLWGHDAYMWGLGRAVFDLELAR